MGTKNSLRRRLMAGAAALFAVGLIATGVIAADASGDFDEPPGARLGEDLRPLEARARDFAGDGRVLAALHELPGTTLPREVQADPEGFLARYGIRLPEGLAIRFINFPGPKKPAPDFEWFSIRQFDCRTYYLRTKDDDGPPRIETVEICFGFEVIPKNVPPVG